MTKAKQCTIRAYIAIRNHHEQLLEAAIARNDQQAIQDETKKLEALKLMLA